MDDIFRLQLPYYQIVHVVIVGVRIGAMLLFSPIWGSPAIPGQVRLFLVFVTAAGISTVIPFNQAAYEHPEMVLGTEFFIGLLLGMGGPHRVRGPAVRRTHDWIQRGLFGRDRDRSADF